MTNFRKEAKFESKHEDFRVFDRPPRHSMAIGKRSRVGKSQEHGESLLGLGDIGQCGAESQPLCIAPSPHLTSSGTASTSKEKSHFKAPKMKNFSPSSFTKPENHGVLSPENLKAQIQGKPNKNSTISWAMAWGQNNPRKPCLIPLASKQLSGSLAFELDSMSRELKFFQLKVTAAFGS